MKFMLTKSDPITVDINEILNTKRIKIIVVWRISIKSNMFLSLLEDNSDFKTVWSNPNFRIEERIMTWENFWKYVELNSTLVIRGKTNEMATGRSPDNALNVKTFIVSKCLNKKWSLSTWWFD